MKSRAAVARRLRARARSRRRERNCRSKHPGRGLYVPAAGSPDAPYVAPDASGDHRAKTHRGFQSGKPPDDGHRTLALASGALGHAWLSTGRTTPDATGTLFLRPVSAVQHTHRTGRTETTLSASSGVPLGPFSTWNFAQLLPNQVPTSKRHK